MSIEFKNEYVSNVMDYDDEFFSIENFQKNFKVRIIEMSEDKLTTDLIGIDASIANALRRILLSEIPTVAIEYVKIKNNTSVIQDEILAHRLGLIPIKVDPRKLEFRDGKEATENNTIIFTLDVKCIDKKDVENEIQKNRKKIEDYHVDDNYKSEKKLFKNDPRYPKLLQAMQQSLTERDKTLFNHRVLSCDLKWKPFGNQQEIFPEGIKPVHNDILIAKLAKNQEISLEMECVKGIGKTHAKWSPVCTAFYRMMPKIKIESTITEKEEKEIYEKCPKKVFDIEDSHLKVKNSRDCTMCRECLRISNSIKLFKDRNHFIFEIESTGILSAQDLFVEALHVFSQKCQNILAILESGKKQPQKTQKKQQTKKFTKQPQKMDIDNQLDNQSLSKKQFQKSQQNKNQQMIIEQESPNEDDQILSDPQNIQDIDNQQEEKQEEKEIKKKPKKSKKQK